MKEFTCPPLSEDDAFNSNPNMGFVAYRLPSIPTLLGQPMEQFDTYTVMTFTLKIKIFDDLAQEYRYLSCGDASKCHVYYKKSVTPVMYTLAPPVVYYGSKTTLYFDPKSTMSHIKGLLSDELPWINVKINGALLDFDEQADFDISINSWNRNGIQALVGDQPISANQNVTMLWETGQAYNKEHKMKHCDFENKNCYQAKTVPVINTLSSNSGYVSGGQNLTVTGYGFGSGNIVAKVGDLPCAVTSHDKHSFSCTIKESGAVSDQTLNYVGQHGIRKTLVNSSADADNRVGLDTLDSTTSDKWVRTEHLDLELESFKG